MAPKHLRGAPHIIDPGAAVPPALDLSRRQSERRAANHRLLARLKALERSQKTQTPRAYARRYGREQESLILGLLAAGGRREYYRLEAAPCAEQKARTQGRGDVR